MQVSRQDNIMSDVDRLDDDTRKTDMTDKITLIENFRRQACYQTKL